MAKKTTKTGKALERQVADAYRAMGARKVEHDVELAGHQIDVYVEMETADRSLHRIAVEAKDYTKPVGIKIVADFAAVVNSFRDLKLIDEGVVVSAAGFSRPARNAAKKHSLRLLEPADLEAMVGGPDPAQMRTDYLASLRQRFEYLDLGGIAPRVQNRTVKLRMDDVFVPVQARPELESRDEWPDWMEEPESEEIALRMLARGGWEGSVRPAEIPDLLSHQRMVILGDPGSGKSTLLRYVAYAVACRKSENVDEATLERLPIFVRIVQFSQAQAEDNTLMLDTYIREVCEPKWAPLFQHALDSGETLVLLDGLDEVVDAHQRKSVAGAIQRLVADYPGNAFFVTSRIVGYQAARLSGDFAHYTIQPLPPERIAEFVEKWYAAIEREAGEAELSEEARERAEGLSRTIQERPGIHRLAENPLLLTIIALVNWRGRKLPNRRVELYAHAAETLIASWPYRRQGVEMDTERVTCLLSPVAYRIFATRSSGDIAEDELLPILTEAICRVDGVDEREAKIYADEFLGQISERSGIFRERGYDERGRRVFGFLHLTFAEYFTARHLAVLWERLGEDGEGRRTLLRQYAHVPRWREVMLLLAGDVGLRDNDDAERATRLLGDILTLGSDYEDRLHRDLLLAGECLADDLRVQPKAARYAVGKLSELVPDPVGKDIEDIFCAMRETAYGQLVLESLRGQLEDDDEWARRSAAWMLGALGDSWALGSLLQQLEDMNWRIRRRAAEQLGALGDLCAIEPLLARLNDEYRRVRERAAEALGTIGGQQTVDELLAQLEEGNPAVQGKAAWALGCIGNMRAVEPLLARLDDPNLNVRLNAASALGRIGDARAVEPLLAWLKHRNRNMRINAVSALGRIGDVRAVEPLLVQLEDKNSSVRASVASALGRIGDVRAVEPLLAWLKDEDSNVRWFAASALGSIRDVRAVEPLLALLEDTDTNVRWQAALALGHIGDIRAVDGLLTRLDDVEAWVRANAAGALGKLGETQAVEPLLARLEDKDSLVRGSVAEALGMLGDICAVGDLLIRLDDEEWDVRAKAYEALIAILNHNTPQPEIEEVTCEPQAVSGPWDNEPAQF